MIEVNNCFKLRVLERVGNGTLADWTDFEFQSEEASSAERVGARTENVGTEEFLETRWTVKTRKHEKS